MDPIFTKLLLAVLLGGLLGLEREYREKHAGLKTNTLVCLGATLFTISSLYFPGSDLSRVAAQIVTGVGFIGAGVILHSKGDVFGITTAATLWIVAGIGMAVGLGFYFGAAITTLLALLVLEGSILLKVKEKAGTLDPQSN